MKESEIQSKIIKNHKESGWLAIKLIQTNTNGIPDLLLIKEGQVVFVEVKSQYKKPTPLQEYVHGQLRKAGVNVFVANSPDFLL
jgi:Holliday junction resolvase